MKKIYYLKHPVKIGDVIEHNGLRATVTEELIRLNPELFIVEDTMQELLDKAKRDYPVGTMIDSRNGIQEVLGDNPFVGIGIEGSIQVNTDKFPGGGTIYTPENGWSKILPLKFTTEDGVNIYGDMKTYAVAKEDLDIDAPEIYGGNSTSFKYFYYKENALAYIEKHREKTLEDYENMLFERGNSMTFSPKSAYFSVYGWIKDNEPKLYYTKILQLIADDLNDGWVADFNDVNQCKHSLREVGSGLAIFNLGIVYFKSKDLVEKARDILGDKLDYLFNKNL